MKFHYKRRFSPNVSPNQYLTSPLLEVSSPCYISPSLPTYFYLPPSPQHHFSSIIFCHCINKAHNNNRLSQHQNHSKCLQLLQAQLQPQLQRILKSKLLSFSQSSINSPRGINWDDVGAAINLDGDDAKDAFNRLLSANMNDIRVKRVMKQRNGRDPSTRASSTNYNESVQPGNESDDAGCVCFGC